jgi:hypothetical protein
VSTGIRLAEIGRTIRTTRGLGRERGRTENNWFLKTKGIKCYFKYSLYAFLFVYLNFV